MSKWQKSLKQAVWSRESMFLAFIYLYIKALNFSNPSRILAQRAKLYPIKTKLTSPNIFVFPRVSTWSDRLRAPICATNALRSGIRKLGVLAIVQDEWVDDPRI